MHAALAKPNIITADGPFESVNVRLVFRRGFQRLNEVNRVLSEEQLNLNRIFRRYTLTFELQNRQVETRRNRIGGRRSISIYHNM